MLLTPHSVATDGIIPAIQTAGGKGSGLYWLQANGFRTPATWVLSTSEFDTMIEEAGLTAAVQEIDQATASSPDWTTAQQMLNSVEPQRQIVVKALQESPWPDTIRAAFAQLPRRDSAQWAVRSSATVEDWRNYSYAGQFLSMLAVPAASVYLERAIRAIWASVFKPEVLAYRAQFASPLPKMAVILQPMQPITPQERSGVAFSCSPIPDMPGQLIQSTFGAGRGVVEGLGGDLYAILDDKVATRPMPPMHITISGKDGEIQASTPPGLSLTPDEARIIAAHITTMAQRWSRPVNAEFVWYHEQPQPIFVQVRTDTSQPPTA